MDEECHSEKLTSIKPDVLTITGLIPDRSGINAFVIVIRDSMDPERQPRAVSAQYGRVWLKWKRRLRETTVEVIAEEIMSHLSDGQVRTFNRISVEMLDKTADITFGTKFEDALWLLVLQKRVEYTPQAPVLFRIRTRVAWDATEELCPNPSTG